MKIEPIDHADLDLVKIREHTNGRFYPFCKKHGAMNKVSEFGYWRCIRSISLKTGRVNPEHDCRAGCKY